MAGLCHRQTPTCGVALGADGLERYSQAFKDRPTSAFGGIIALNCPLDERCAADLKQFVEVLMAPAFSRSAGSVQVKVVRVCCRSRLPAGGTAWLQRPLRWTSNASDRAC
jgi:phosphoribosylaminoimidazolecarboxamide formyltransferase/IMP cyclohydrolase